MGREKYKVMVVTGLPEDVAKVRKKAKKILNKAFPYESVASNPDKLVSEPIQSLINGYHTFMIAPDGSKEGWDIQKQATEARLKIGKWIDKAIDQDHLCVDYVEVMFGRDQTFPQILQKG